MEQGITLAGGGALLLGLDRRLQNELKMPVYRAEDPLTCVARGTGRVAEALHLYQRALASGQELRRPVRLGDTLRFVLMQFAMLSWSTRSVGTSKRVIHRRAQVLALRREVVPCPR